VGKTKESVPQYTFNRLKLVFVQVPLPNARAKKALITNRHHLILEAAHPSPLSAYNGFFGCKHFSKCNAFLRSHALGEIDWDLTK
jgi:uracil DNA glycosylase